MLLKTPSIETTYEDFNSFNMAYEAACACVCGLPLFLSSLWNLLVCFLYRGDGGDKREKD